MRYGTRDSMVPGTALSSLYVIGLSSPLNKLPWGGLGILTPLQRRVRCWFHVTLPSPSCFEETVGSIFSADCTSFISCPSNFIFDNRSRSFLEINIEECKEEGSKINDQRT